MEKDNERIENIGPFILGKTLGEGSTGKVKLGIHKVTGKKVAIKIMKKSLLTSKPQLRRKVEREIAVMKLMNHPHVVRLFDVLQTKKYLFLIIENVEGGELFDYIVNRGRISMEEAFSIFKQIINGVEYCHEQLICHRDLKPENLLLDKNKNVKIADFGMASMMSEGKLLETSCGSPHYASPEVVKGEKYNGMGADIWSCGVILFALVTGRLPFDDDNLQVLLMKVRRGTFKFPSFLVDDCKDLISNMLKVNPQERITIPEIKKHPWWIRMEKKLSEQNKEKGEEKKEPPDEEKKKTTTTTNTQQTENQFDEEIIQIIEKMGWSEPKKLRESLSAETKNVEKVLYNLLLQKKQDGTLNKDDPFETTSSQLSVSITNPITTDIDTSDLLKQRLMELKNSKPSMERRNSGAKLGTTPPEEKKPWFAFWRRGKKKEKKEDDKALAFGLHSNKTQQEIIGEVARAFKVLHIQWNTTGDTTIRAKFIDELYTVEFDISLVSVPQNGYLLNFTRVSGDERASRILFDVLQQELQL